MSSQDPPPYDSHTFASSGAPLSGYSQPYGFDAKAQPPYPMDKSPYPVSQTTYPGYYPPAGSSPYPVFSQTTSTFPSNQPGMSPYPVYNTQPTTNQPGASPYPVFNAPHASGIPRATPVMTTWRFRRNACGTNTSCAGNEEKRFHCGHCRADFMFWENGVARCPSCRKVSVMGNPGAKKRAQLFILIGVLVLLLTVGIAAVTIIFGQFRLAFIWAGGFAFGVGIIVLGAKYFCMAKSLQADG